MSISRRDFIKILGAGIAIPVLPINVVGSSNKEIGLHSTIPRIPVRLKGRYYKSIDKFFLDVAWSQPEIGKYGISEVNMHTSGIEFSGEHRSNQNFIRAITYKVNKLFEANGFGHIKLIEPQVMEAFLNASV